MAVRNLKIGVGGLKFTTSNCGITIARVALMQKLPASENTGSVRCSNRALPLTTVSALFVSNLAKEKDKPMFNCNTPFDTDRAREDYLVAAWLESSDSELGHECPNCGYFYSDDMERIHYNPYDDTWCCDECDQSEVGHE